MEEFNVLQLVRAQYTPSRIFPGQPGWSHPSGRVSCSLAGLFRIPGACLLPPLMQEQGCVGGGRVPLVERQGQGSVAATAVGVCRFSNEPVSYLIHFPVV